MKIICSFYSIVHTYLFGMQNNKEQETTPHVQRDTEYVLRLQLVMIVIVAVMGRLGSWQTNLMSLHLLFLLSFSLFATYQAC
jgi:hypothetical protein